MLEVIKNLLALQERDRKLLRIREELSRIPPERQTLSQQATTAQSKLDAAKEQVKHIETERKKLELEVETQKQMIDRYSVQQLQTRKNEEYRALTHEIDGCKAVISKLEDQILELMEKADAARSNVGQLTKEGLEVKKLVDGKVAEIDSRELQLKAEQSSLDAGRADLAGAVEEPVRVRYERLFKSKGNNVVVGIQRGVCGGCHMALQRQTVVSCQADQEVVACPNCGRILYFTPDMDTAVLD